MAYQFINIEQKDDRSGEWHRSTLLLSDKRHPLDRGISTVGIIPHTATWRPATASDRDVLVNYLTGLEYNHED